MGKGYKTVERYGESEVVIEKSKFFGYVEPVENEAEAESFIAHIKSKHKEATHNVPIYLVGQNYELQRYSDDGEPSGTAGVPILEMLKKEGITNVAMVITRYYGGIKLGTGGLVRAYTNSAKLALEKAGIVTKVEHQLISVKIGYTFLGKVQSELLNEGFIIKDIQFSEAVMLYIYSLCEKVERLEEMLINLTNGQCQIECLDCEYLSLKEG